MPALHFEGLSNPFLEQSLLTGTVPHYRTREHISQYLKSAPLLAIRNIDLHYTRLPPTLNDTETHHTIGRDRRLKNLTEDPKNLIITFAKDGLESLIALS